MKTVRINQETVKPIKGKKIKDENIKGFSLFPEIYSNVFLCARKQSGKTSVINTIIKKCTDKDTNLYIFCSTHEKDNNWIEIKKWLKTHNYNAFFFTSLVESGINMVDVIIEDLRKTVESDAEESSSSSSEEESACNFDCKETHITIKIKKRKKKLIAPKVMFIFDDISGELKDKEIAKLLKTNRHFKSKCIISSQWPNDLDPQSRKQIDYFLLFKGHQDEKLEELYKNMDLPNTFEEFKSVYDFATEKDYSFLYVDTRTDSYRKNFDEKIIISKKDV